jgi:hypothetical protein
MIEAPAYSGTASLNANFVRRKHPATLTRSQSRALTVIPTKPVSTWAQDLRFFAICYLAGFIFFLIMLS